MEITTLVNTGVAPSVTPVKANPVQDDTSAIPAPSAALIDKTNGAQAEVDTADIESKRYKTVAKAAQTVANPYVVSDKKFTIFKDATGQYITRFTNLRDGKVTYIPEPRLLRQLEQSNQQTTRLLAINA